MLELPKGWVWATVSTAIEKVPLSGRKLKRSEYQEEGILPVIDQGQIFVGGYTDRQELKAPCEPPVIIFGDHTKVIKYVNFDFVAGADGVRAIKPLGAFSPKLFYYFLQAIELPEKGYARHFQFLEKSFIPLPPLPEQHRIVAKIEELFTRLDAGVEALKKIKAQLKRYRQSVLKHAFEGKLTEEWRQAHKHELEPASVLLDRIKQERHKTAKGKYKELPPRDTTDLPELPKGWVWSNFEELKKAQRNAIKAGPFGSSLKKESYVPHGYRIYGQEQVIRQNPSYGNYYIGEEKYTELKSCAVKPGDILISLVGTIGKVLILPEDSEPGIINPRLIKLSLEERLVDNKYIKAYIESSTVRDFFTLASHGETMEILNLGILRTLPIPVPSPTEQHKIVSEIERRFSVADEIEKTIDHSLKQSERLRQSILRRAFEGKLVPQEPNDEPAEKLLERIRQERARQQAERKPARSSRNKSNTKQMGLV